jgi:FtsZ-interacting cell division protein ZipA
MFAAPERGAAMSTGLVIVLIVVGVLILIALFLAGRKRQERRLESQRIEAGSHREEAELRGARAQRAEAEAREQAIRAEKEKAAAEEHADRARELDPDRDPDRTE